MAKGDKKDPSKFTIEDFDSKHGKTTQMFSDIKPNPTLLDSGLFGFNVAHGIGGIKSGCVMRIMGPPHVGKSSISYRIVADALTKGMSAFILDMEGGFNPHVFEDTLADRGLDANDKSLPVRFISPLSESMEWGDDNYPTIERVIPMIESWIDSKIISPKGAVIVFDSVDGIASDRMIGSKVDDATIALVAKRLKQWLRMYHFKIVQSNSLVIFVHQASANISPMARDTETFTGGRALEYWSKLDLRLKDIGQDKEGDEVVGRKVRGFIKKSKQGVPWRTFEYSIRYDVGPDNYLAVFEAAKKLKIITGTTWFTVPGMEDKIQGKEALRSYWMENPKDFYYIQELVLQSGQVDAIAPKVEEQEEFYVEQEYEGLIDDQ